MPVYPRTRWLFWTAVCLLGYAAYWLACAVMDVIDVGRGVALGG